MIDVHVLTYSGTRLDWLSTCLRSLADQPCRVHVVQGVEGDVGAGRAHAYTLGEHEFVSYVDSDDYVLPGALAACLEALQTHRAVVTRERRLWGSMFDSSTLGGHHLTVYRREDVLPHLGDMRQLPYHCDRLLTHRLAPTQLDMVGYVWRMHECQGHRLATPEHDKAWEVLCRS